MGQLDAKTSIITGAAGGIGLEIARRFHQEGANVLICDCKAEKLTKASAQISDSGERICAVEADVTLEEDIQKVINQSVEHFGGVNILVNNAGVLKVNLFPGCC